jgi:hypothetical protein
MACRGIVRDGRVELEPGVQLPEGSVVRIEPIELDWVADWAEYARRVSEASRDSRPALEILAETRR